MERNECLCGKSGLQSSLKGKKRREKEKERKKKKKDHPHVSSQRQMRQTCLPSLIGMV